MCGPRSPPALSASTRRSAPRSPPPRRCPRLYCAQPPARHPRLHCAQHPRGPALGSAERRCLQGGPQKPPGARTPARPPARAALTVALAVAPAEPRHGPSRRSQRRAARLQAPRPRPPSSARPCSARPGAVSGCSWGRPGLRPGAGRGARPVGLIQGERLVSAGRRGLQTERPSGRRGRRPWGLLLSRVLLEGKGCPRAVGDPGASWAV